MRVTWPFPQRCSGYDSGERVKMPCSATVLGSVCLIRLTSTSGWSLNSTMHLCAAHSQLRGNRRICLLSNTDVYDTGQMRRVQLVHVSCQDNVSALCMEGAVETEGSHLEHSQGCQTQPALRLGRRLRCWGQTSLPQLPAALLALRMSTPCGPC